MTIIYLRREFVRGLFVVTFCKRPHIVCLPVPTRGFFNSVCRSFSCSNPGSWSTDVGVVQALGPIVNLFDDNSGTYGHSGATGRMHFFTIDLQVIGTAVLLSYYAY